MEYGLQMYSVRDITKTDLEGAMKAVAEDRGCTYEDVLAAVRKEACC